ncbi:MAG TPA: hypothetical protein VEF72_06825 [Mycobacterium sp.]|nr:hypothetical protein [Mycobacterium sp.]
MLALNPQQAAVVSAIAVTVAPVDQPPYGRQPDQPERAGDEHSVWHPPDLAAKRDP